MLYLNYISIKLEEKENGKWRHTPDAKVSGGAEVRTLPRTLRTEETSVGRKSEKEGIQVYI